MGLWLGQCLQSAKHAGNYVVATIGKRPSYGCHGKVAPLLWASTPCPPARSTIHFHISPLPVCLSVRPSVSLAATSPFPIFFVTFPASSYSSLPHLSFMPQWPPHRLQTGSERHATFEASWQDDWAEAGGTRRLNVTTQNPDIHAR